MHVVAFPNLVALQHRVEQRECKPRHFRRCSAATTLQRPPAIHVAPGAGHLGFWQNKEGDNRHTGMNEISGSPIYFELGRLAVLKFAQSNPKEFVDVVGSQQTKADWKRRQNETEVE